MPFRSWSPQRRADLLAGIQPEEAAEQHEKLRDVFLAEMDYRRTSGPQEYFENLYHCAFLLYCIGDPADVPMMWEAKHINFDTGCAFDVQFMVGAGREKTLRYLRQHERAHLADDLSAYPELSEDLADWAESRRSYFYGSS